MQLPVYKTHLYPPVKVEIWREILMVYASMDSRNQTPEHCLAWALNIEKKLDGNCMWIELVLELACILEQGEDV